MYFENTSMFRYHVWLWVGRRFLGWPSARLVPLLVALWSIT